MKQNQNEFFAIIMGTMSTGAFLAYFFLSLFGIIVGLLLHSTTRDVKSFTTPVQFSWAFLLSDNVKRIIASLCCTLIAIRFTPELLQVELKPWVALLIGLGIDYIVGLIKDATTFLREKRIK